MTLLYQLKGSSEGCATFEQFYESIPKMIDDFPVQMLISPCNSHYLAEGVVDTMCVDVQTIVYFVY